jgi:hypothetical protein
VYYEWEVKNVTAKRCAWSAKRWKRAWNGSRQKVIGAIQEAGRREWGCKMLKGRSLEERFGLLATSSKGRGVSLLIESEKNWKRAGMRQGC